MSIVETSTGAGLIIFITRPVKHPKSIDKTRPEIRPETRHIVNKETSRGVTFRAHSMKVAELPSASTQNLCRGKVMDSNSGLKPL